MSGVRGRFILKVLSFSPHILTMFHLNANVTLMAPLCVFYMRVVDFFIAIFFSPQWFFTFLQPKRNTFCKLNLCIRWLWGIMLAWKNKLTTFFCKHCQHVCQICRSPSTITLSSFACFREKLKLSWKKESCSNFATIISHSGFFYFFFLRKWCFVNASCVC